MAIALVISIFLLLQFTDSISNAVLECSTDTDCFAINAKCNNNICQCPFGHVFNMEYTSCLPIAVGIDAECSDDNQCTWLLGKNRCNKNKCDCEEGWRYYDGRCIKKAELNKPCTKDEECFNGYDTLAMVCDEVCKCNEGYYLRGDYDCRPKTTTIGSSDFCSLDSDCHIENSVCLNSHCILKTARKIEMSEGHEGTYALYKNITSEDKLQSTVYNTDCTTDDDCSTLQNGVCYQLIKKCICKRGYFLSGETCIPELGKDIGCTQDSDCRITPGRCINGKCYCRKTYFSGKANRVCQKPMTQDNLFCNNAERCNVLGREVFCDSQNQCRCKASATLNEHFVCKPTDQGGIEVCEEGQECTSIINSFCIDQKCQCKPNYRLENNICLPNIQAACDGEKMPCTIENSYCRDDRLCTCSDTFVTNEDNTKCLKVASGLEDQCELDTQCSATIKNSICFEEACKCLDGYTVKNGTCYAIKFMGDLCTDVTQCHIKLESKVQCRNSICQCSADMQPTENGLDCEPVGSTSSVILPVDTIVLFITFHLILKLQFNIK